MNIKTILPLLLLIAACGGQPESDTNSETELSLLVGVDVSSYQGTVDWSEVAAAGKSFTFIRATQGTTVQDTNYAANYSGAKAAGLYVGAYHFYQTNDDAQDQANNFIQTANLQSGDLAPVVDVEALAAGSPNDWTEVLQQFLQILEDQYKIKPFIYTDPNFANEYLGGFGDYPLWIADYDVTAPTVPSAWSSWVFWQYSQDGTVSGIDTAVDLDRFQGTKVELRPYQIP